MPFIDWLSGRLLDWAPGPRGTTVAVVGAGFDQYVDPCKDMPPPLVNGFFRRGLSEPISHTVIPQLMDPVFEFIDLEFGRDQDWLKDHDFSVEECLTQLDYLIQTEPEGGDTWIRLTDVRSRLLTFMTGILSVQGHFHPPSHLMMAFAADCLRTATTVISFNYDTFLEAAAELMSGMSEKLPPYRNAHGLPDWSHADDETRQLARSKWKRTLCYGIEFDDIDLPWAPGSGLVSGQDYYRLPANHLYEAPILKLHGSLNWFQYIPRRVIPSPPGSSPSDLEFGDRKRRILLKDTVVGGFHPAEQDGWQLDPIIVPPTGLKEGLLDTAIFRRLWSTARAALAGCRKLVSVGYSYGAADYRIRSELRHAFAGRGLEELVVVNRSPDSLEILKELCHPDSWRHYTSLDQYVLTECPRTKMAFSRMSREQFASMGLASNTFDVRCGCRLCQFPQPYLNAENLDWDAACARADSMEWTVCPICGGRQLSGSGDKTVNPHIPANA
jgi:hypothetical protein